MHMEKMGDYTGVVRMNPTGLHIPIAAAPSWQYSFFDLSVPDLIVVGLMIVVFVLAIAIPFSGGHHDGKK